MATYTIKSGDSLWKIAQETMGSGSKYAELAAANGISPSATIYAGQTLNIPGTTQSSASKTSTTTAKPVAITTDPTATKLAQLEASKPTYKQSQAVTDAYNKLTQYENNKPGEYQSKYSDQIQSLLDKVLNREQFTYDLNADPLYQQYKDQYVRLGKNAMLDTMANAASLTGGYGNSYASTAGNQAYQGYLNELNNIAPELYSQAYQKYRDDGTEMYNQLGTLQGLDESDYGKYRDTVSDYYNDLQYYYNKYGDMSEADYNKYLNNLSAWQNDRAYYYGKKTDAEQLAFQKEQAAQSQANWEKEYALSLANSRKSSGGGSNGRTGAVSDAASAAKNAVSNAIKMSEMGFNDFLQAAYDEWNENGKNSALEMMDDWVKNGYITNQQKTAMLVSINGGMSH